MKDSDILPVGQCRPQTGGQLVPLLLFQSPTLRTHADINASVRLTVCL